VPTGCCRFVTPWDHGGGPSSGTDGSHRDCDGVPRCRPRPVSVRWVRPGLAVLTGYEQSRCGPTLASVPQRAERGGAGSTWRIAIADQRTGGGTSSPGPEVTSSSIRTSVPPSWAASSTRTRAAPIGQARALSTSSRPGSASSTDVVSSSSSGHPPPNGAAGHRAPATPGPPTASGRHPPPSRCRASRRPAPPTRLQAGQTPSAEHRSRPPRTRSGTGARGCRSHQRPPAGIL